MQITLAEDGLPSDPRMRDLAVRALGEAYHLIRQGGSYGSSVHQVKHNLWRRDSERELRPHAGPVLAALVEGGFLATEPAGHGRSDILLRFVRGVSGTGERAETGEGRLVALAGGLAARCSTDPETQERIRDAFLGFRALNSVSSTWGGTLALTARGKPLDRPAFLFPVSFRMDPVAGPSLGKAFLVMRMPNGRLEGRIVPKEASRSRTRGFSAVVTVDLPGCVPWDVDDFKLKDLAVSPLRTRRLHPNIRATFVDWRPLGRQAKAAGAFLGPALDASGWKRFVSSVGRGRGNATHIARHVYEIVEPEVRAACSRSPLATVELANWYAGRDARQRKRRIQACQAYPLLARELPRLGKVIDAGEPLAPAVGAMLGLPPVLVRHLRGTHWQGVGKARESLVAGRKHAELISKVVAAVPPERLPRTKEQWLGFALTVTKLDSILKWPMPPRIPVEASADWLRIPALSAANLDHSLGALVDAVGAAVDPFWNREGFKEATHRAVVAAVVGNGGLGRLDRFNADWHRHVGAILSLRRQVEREAWGDAPRGWLPLTPAPFASGGGRIEWLTDCDALAAEGVGMSHCVGTRDDACLYDQSHVGVVHGADGGRSTVEVALVRTKAEDGTTGWEIQCWEHKGHRNSPPSADCEGVVSALVAKGVGRVDAEAIQAARSVRLEWLAQRDAYDLRPEHRTAILAAYDPCLPKDIRGLGPEGWRPRIMAAGGADAPPPKRGSAARVGRGTWWRHPPEMGAMHAGDAIPF